MHLYALESLFYLNFPVCSVCECTEFSHAHSRIHTVYLQHEFSVLKANLFEQKNKQTSLASAATGESVSSGNENASLELSSYWELANLWPYNTPVAPLFVTCWMLVESETIGEDRLLTSSFSEHLIVDLPRLNLLRLWPGILSLHPLTQICTHSDPTYCTYVEDTQVVFFFWNCILQAQLNLDNVWLLHSVKVKMF